MAGATFSSKISEMCGIVGIVGDVPDGTIEMVTDVVRHRGPDSVGFYSHGDIRLGIRRLSIIDLEFGDQPIYNETGEMAIVFNGEIYNYKPLRRQLEARHHVFRTNSDTEVVLHLYEEYGVECLNHLQGMFAFAILNGNELFIARDRLGIKPLYYSLAGGRFIFASEIKALLRSGLLDVSLSAAGLTDFLIWGAPLANRTLFENIFCLRPGHYLIINRCQERIRLQEAEYYRVSIDPDPKTEFNAASAQLADLLRSTVASHLIADVEVGLSCSGGLDSSILAVLMAELSGDRILAFSFGDRVDHPDIVNARRVCAILKCRHEIIVPEFSDYLKAIPGCLLAIERPTRSLYGLPFYMLSQYMGKRVKVALCGEGADEIFGGYREFRDRHSLDWVPDRLQTLKSLGLAVSDEAEELARMVVPGKDDEASYLRRTFCYNMRRLAVHHLEPTDKYAMSASLELRVPYMDHKVLEFAHRLPFDHRVQLRQKSQKLILKDVAVKHLGSPIASVVERRKLGFPQAISQPLAKIRKKCEELLPGDYRTKHDFGQLFPRKWELLLFDLFHEIFVRRKGDLNDHFDFGEFVKSR